MIQSYRVPQKKIISKDQILTISQQYQVKDAIYNKKITKVKQIIMKNSNINDDTIGILWTITQPFSCVHLNLAENFSFITDKAIGHICQIQRLDYLKYLNLADNNITDEGIQTLAKCMKMIHLQELIVYGNSDISSTSLITLARSDYIKEIKNLDLHATSIQDDGVICFVQSANSVKLQNLNLSMNWKRITDISLFAIAESKYCVNLEILNVQDCGITNQSIQSIAQSQSCQKIHTLILNNSMKQKNNYISDQALNFIAYAKHMRHLKVLQLRNTQVSTAGIRILATSLSSQFLQTLRLSYCKNIDDGIKIPLRTLMEYQSFKKVYLNNTSVSKQTCEQFEKEYPQINIVF